MPDRAPFFGIVAGIAGYLLADSNRWRGHPVAWAGLLGFAAFATVTTVQKQRGQQPAATEIYS